MNPTKKSREMVPERIYDILLNARTADKVSMRFKDGRQVQGALIFNPFKGTGRLINIERETSIDFSVDDIRELKLTPTTTATRAKEEEAKALAASEAAAAAAEATAEPTPEPASEPAAVEDSKKQDPAPL